MHITRLFQDRVHQHQYRPALVLGTGRSLSYQALGVRISRLAGWLRYHLGLFPEDRVAISMKNSAEYVEIILASWHAGLCIVPLDDRYTLEEIKTILADTGASVCFSEGETCLSMSQAFEELPCLDLIDIRSELYQYGSHTAPSMEAFSHEGKDTAWLVYETPSPGYPGQLISHDALTDMAQDFFKEMHCPSTVNTVVHALPFFKASGLCSLIYLIQSGLEIIPVSRNWSDADLQALNQQYPGACFFTEHPAHPYMLAHSCKHGHDQTELDEPKSLPHDMKGTRLPIPFLHSGRLKPKPARDRQDSNPHTLPPSPTAFPLLLMRSLSRTVEPVQTLPQANRIPSPIIFRPDSAFPKGRGMEDSAAYAAPPQRFHL